MFTDAEKIEVAKIVEARIQLGSALNRVGSAIHDHGGAPHRAMFLELLSEILHASERLGKDAGFQWLTSTLSRLTDARLPRDVEMAASRSAASGPTQ